MKYKVTSCANIWIMSVKYKWIDIKITLGVITTPNAHKSQKLRIYRCVVLIPKGVGMSAARVCLVPLLVVANVAKVRNYLDAAK